MLTIIFVIAVLLMLGIATVLIMAANKPDGFRIERATSIKAPPEQVFALINDFRAWAAWSPWEKIDAVLKRTYSGPASGKGAVYAWEGKKAGVGRMEIVESVPASRIAITLDFVKPMEAHNRVDFTLAPRGETTYVTWVMQCETPFLAKIFHVFVDMDRMVGKDFEAGLASLKTITEK